MIILDYFYTIINIVRGGRAFIIKKHLKTERKYAEEE